jgi:hypothetical protein
VSAAGDFLLPHLPKERILAAYAAAGGNEIEGGKLASPESSAALVANAFGYFLDRPGKLPPLLPELQEAWPAVRALLEAQLRFPWSGGRHPWLDVLVETETHLIGIESKRYEPFRSKATPSFSDAYSRDVWGQAMSRYGIVRDRIAGGSLSFAHLDGAQLVKHAYGLRTAVNGEGPDQGKRPVLVYLFAEPTHWSDGRPIGSEVFLRHRNEVASFRDAVAGDEVDFWPLDYSTLVDGWRLSGDQELAAHAAAIADMIAPQLAAEGSPR